MTPFPNRCSRRDFLRRTALCAGAAMAAPALSAVAAPEGRTVRNIVFILIDDLGVMDLTVQGSTYYETPNVDRLAATGMRFTDGYAAHPVCSPTRVSIMTGRYPARVKVNAHLPGYVRPHGKLATPEFIGYMRDAEVTYAEAFRRAGYRTCHVGKWHITSRTQAESHGFETVTPQLNPGSNRDVEDAWFVRRYTHDLLDFIEQHKEERFLAVLSHGTVHVPLYESPELIAKYRDKPPGENGQDNPTMGAMVERMDWSVGQVLDKLEELGLAEETAIVFTSDNGGLTNVWDEELGRTRTATSNLPFRGGKSQLYEGGIRVPFIIRWPGVTEPGSTCSVPVITNDLYPTFLEMTGQPPMPEQHLDGLSLAPLLRGEGELDRNNLYWYYPRYHTMAPHGAVRSADWKLIEHYEDGRIELFNLTIDPAEQRDLSEQLPDIADRLRGYLRRHLDAIGAGLPTPNPDYLPANPTKDQGHGTYDPLETHQDEDPREIVTDPAIDAGATWPPPK